MERAVRWVQVLGVAALQFAAGTAVAGEGGLPALQADLQLLVQPDALDVLRYQQHQVEIERRLGDFADADAEFSPCVLPVPLLLAWRQKAAKDPGSYSTVLDHQAALARELGQLLDEYRLAPSDDARLLVLGRMDQRVRRDFGQAPPTLSAAQRNLHQNLSTAYLCAVDRFTTAMLAQYLSAHGWPSRSRTSATLDEAAWLILLHASHRPGLQGQWLAANAALVEQGDTDVNHYARLFDRVAVQDGRPQRYGTQYHCRDGRIVLAGPADDLQAMLERRQSLQLTAPLPDLGTPCDW